MLKKLIIKLIIVDQNEIINKTYDSQFLNGIFYISCSSIRSCSPHSLVDQSKQKLKLNIKRKPTQVIGKRCEKAENVTFVQEQKCHAW